MEPSWEACAARQHGMLSQRQLTELGITRATVRNQLRAKRKLTTADRIVISCSAYELRHDPDSVMEDLIALGVPRLKRAG